MRAVYTMETEEGDPRSCSWRLCNDHFVLFVFFLRTESATEYSPGREYSLAEGCVHNAITVILVSEATQKDKSLSSLEFHSKQKWSSSCHLSFKNSLGESATWFHLVTSDAIQSYTITLDFLDHFIKSGQSGTFSFWKIHLTESLPLHDGMILLKLLPNEIERGLLLGKLWPT